MSTTGYITNETQRFQASVKKLSVAINETAINWHDEKHQKLAQMVSQIAASSKSVVASADRLAGDVSRFEALASQN